MKISHLSNIRNAKDAIMYILCNLIKEKRNSLEISIHSLQYTKTLLKLSAQRKFYTSLVNFIDSLEMSQSGSFYLGSILCKYNLRVCL